MTKKSLERRMHRLVDRSHEVFLCVLFSPLLIPIMVVFLIHSVVELLYEKWEWAIEKFTRMSLFLLKPMYAMRKNYRERRIQFYINKGWRKR